MIIKGLQKTTLLDFPGKVACTVFTGGCNFRCPFCHNATLVLDPAGVESINEDDFFSYINKRKGILDGVCITGGEPLMQKGIVDFIKKIKDTGLLVKLDTNGAYPEVLKELLDKNLIDYVAMDMKNSFEKYALTVGLDSFPEKIKESIGIIMSSGVQYEFRTTVVKELHTAEDIDTLSRSISGAERYFLQKFTDSGDIMEDGYSSYTDAEMEKLLDIAKKWIPNASLRGV